MKKAISISLAAILLLSLLAACGGSGLSGTYKADDGSGKITFSGSDKFTMSSGGESMSGTYTLSDGKINLIVDGASQSFSFSQNGNTIIIDGMPMTK